MKVLSLNTWAGRASLENLLNFLVSHDDVDIFCFQEIWNGGEKLIKKIFPDERVQEVEWNILEKLAAALPGYNYYFHPCYFDFFGQAVFVKNNIDVLGEGSEFVYREKGYFSTEELGDHARDIQYVHVKTEQGVYTIINFHGLWVETGKDDTEDRLLQSENILNFIKNIQNPIIVCGDFNLNPDTESIKKFEYFGLRNLIREYNITSTRTSLYPKPNRFADYTFVSNGIKVKDFQVLPDEVSDHSPLYLEFT